MCLILWPRHARSSFEKNTIKAGSGSVQLSSVLAGHGCRGFGLEKSFMPCGWVGYELFGWVVIWYFGCCGKATRRGKNGCEQLSKQANRQTRTQADSQNKEASRQAKQGNKQTRKARKRASLQASKQTTKRTSTQTYRHTNTHTNMYKHTCRHTNTRTCKHANMQTTRGYANKQTD